MKDKILLGILLILIVISAIFVHVDSANVEKETLKQKTGDALNLLKDEYVTEDELIYSNKYLVKGKTISRIVPKTSIEEFLKNIEIAKGKEVKIYKGEKEITSGYIGTGMLVKEANGQEYNTSVTGDIRGEGTPSQVELTMIIRHLVGLKGWQLEGIEKDSADITGDGDVNLVDVNKLINYIVYGEWEKEEISMPKAPEIKVITKKDENKDYYIGAVEIKIEEDKSTKNAKTTYTIKGSKEQKETIIKEGEIITLEGEGEYLITAYTYGIKGNKSRGTNKVIKLKDPIPNLNEGNTIIKHTPEEWTKGSVTVSIQTKIEGYTLQYSRDGIKWEDYHQEIEVVQNGKIYARLKDNLGNAGDKVVGSIENIDKIAPTVSLGQNGGANYTMPSTGNAKINTIIKATDSARTDTNGCSGLNTLQYAWSQSKDIEPETWTNFINETKVEKIDITMPGTWYLWVKVTDKAGNIAKKVSNPFIVKANTDVENQIALTPNKTAWTNGDVTVTVTFGENLVQNKTLVCTGTAGTDYVINGVSSVTVKTNGKKVTAVAQDIAGNTVGKELIINNIDKVAPTVSLAPNGGAKYTMPSTGNAKINTILTAADLGGSNLNKLQYAWSRSNTQEPSTWTNFTNGNKVEKTDITEPGTWYLWTKVMDKAGNRATSVKVSNPFVVKANTDVLNQITLTQTPTTWTNGEVTVTASFGKNLVQNKTLVCTGTAGTDYVLNGVSSVVVKTSGKTVTAVAQDIAGNTVVKELIINNIDKIAPTVSLEPNGGANYTVPSIGNAKISTTITATDLGGSNLNTLQYAWSQSNTIKPSIWKNFTNGSTVSKMDISTSGIWYLWIKVTDKAGNKVEKVSNSFVITEANQITLTQTPTTWTNGEVTVTATFGENLVQDKTLICTGTAGTDYVVNGVSSVIVKTNGKTVTATAKDIEGNLVSKTLTISNIDRTLPTMDSLTTNPTTWTNGNVTLTGKATDSQSGIVAYQFSQANNLTASSSGWVNITKSTSQITQTKEVSETGTWYFYVKDAVGNINKNSITVKIDKTAPTMDSLTTNPTTWTNGNVTLTGKATDSQSGIVAYQFSQANNLTATSGGWTQITVATTQITQTKEVSETGTWYFYVKDVAGNVNKISVAVKIDKTAPTMDSLTANPAVCANRNVTLTGKATDSQSGIVAYQFSKINDLTANSDGWTQITVATTQITQTKEVSETGIWYFYVKDRVGNINKKQIAIIIDKTAPTITVPDSIIAGNVINAEVEDLDSGVSYWAYSTTSDIPTTWTSITNIKYGTIPITINTEGTYYIFVKDLAGNISSTSITVIPARWSNVRDKTNYTTLQDALLVANSGDTLRLLSDYDDDSEAVISLNKTITLDTNGKTLTKSINTIRIDEGSTLNLNGTGTIKSTSSSISIFFNLGTLNIYRGTINSDYNIVWNQGNINMSGGTVIGGKESTDEYGTPGIILEEGNVNISGGLISCGGIAIELRGNANIRITGESTIVRGGTCSRWSSIYCTDTASGTITIGTSSSSSNTYPYITSEFGGIDNESTDVRVTRYSGKVD